MVTSQTTRRHFVMPESARECQYRINNTKLYLHMTVNRSKLLFNETNRRTHFQIYSGTKLYMFRVVPPPIIRS